MKLALLLVLAASAAQAEVSFEALLADVSASAKAAKEALAKEKNRRVFPLAARPALPSDISAPLLLDVPLSVLRDGPLNAVDADIGGRHWTVGVTADAGWDDFYLVLTLAGDRILVPLAPIGRFLEPAGVVVADDDGPVLRLNARISILHPINGTSVVAVDVENGRAKDSVSVGELVEALKAKGRPLKLGDQEVHVFSLTEAAEGGKSLSAERAIVFARIAATKTKAWSIRESALEPGRPVRAELASRLVVVLRTVDGRLVVRDAGPAKRS